MGHLRPPDPTALIQDDSLCEKWSKPEPNTHGVMVRVCKCGRAKIIKPSTSNLVVPVLDGEFLPGCWRLNDAKEMIDAAARGDALPTSRQPLRPPVTYTNVGPEVGKAAWAKTIEWAQEHLHGQPTASTEERAKKRLEAFATLELQPDATLAEIKKQWRHLANQYHPDKYLEEDAKTIATEKWTKINEAYDVLTES